MRDGGAVDFGLQVFPKVECFGCTSSTGSPIMLSIKSV